MSKVKRMLDNLEQELRANKQYSAADKLLQIIEEVKREGWTPCSERLPEEPEYGCCGYIVQRKRVEEPHSAWWDGEIWTSDDCDVYKDVIAYMPLPEPYKEE